jgi:hypothetical protein
MLKQMTNAEKALIATKSFTELWNTRWEKPGCPRTINRRRFSGEKFNILKNGVFVNKPAHNHTTLRGRTIIIIMMPKTEYQKPAQPLDYTLESLIADSNEFEIWETAEWGFKGTAELPRTIRLCG